MMLMPLARRHPHLFWPLFAVSITLLLGGVLWLA